MGDYIRKELEGECVARSKAGFILFMGVGCGVVDLQWLNWAKKEVMRRDKGEEGLKEMWEKSRETFFRRIQNM